MYHRVLLIARLSLTLALIAPFASALRAQDDLFDDPAQRQKIASLRGTWRFSVGDNPAWAKPEFDDRDWTKVDLPGDWESEGYRGYNGYAWYRRSFNLPRDQAGRRVYLSLGKIDDVDEVYVNGQLIGGTGQFPPDYHTAWDARRIYPVPAACLRAGEANLIAVRVYDVGGRGGVYEGRLAVFSTNYPSFAINLDRDWTFSAGDNATWAQPQIDESIFTPITVPSLWENAGHADLDGFGWYRVKFTVTEKPSDATLVLLLGRIDDLDEVYLNGTRIGGTGDLEHPRENRGLDFYRQNRGYTFAASLLQGENVLAVRVYDREGGGGIYAGPIGIMTQADYIKFWEQRRRDSNSLWNWLTRFD